MKSIKKRSWVRNFMIGNNVGVLKFQMVQMKDQSHNLSILAPDITSSVAKSLIDNQLYLSEKQQKKVTDFITQKEKEISVFGWFVNAL